MDVSSKLHPILEVASDASNHAQQQCLLHIFVSKDPWSKAGCQSAVDVFPLRQFLQQRSAGVLHIRLDSDSLKLALLEACH